MEVVSSKDSSSVASSPFSSPNISALLKIKIVSWSQETGLPVSIRIRVANRTFNLNCQKLSQESCIEAVQNEMMPLRLIVQALFVQQLNTHQAFKNCSDSFRYMHCGEFSGGLSSSRCPNSKSQNQGESPYTEGAEPGNRPLSFLLTKDLGMHSCEFSRKDYESTSFRIQNLEQELVSLKRTLQLQNISSKTESNPTKPQNIKFYGLESRSLSKKNPLGQVTGCIGHVNFASQRKYASRLLKVFRRISLFGSRKSKRKPGTPGIWAKSILIASDAFQRLTMSVVCCLCENA